ncbi:hypothetical protein [Tardiphaga sp. 709]|uniref:hypothetical protein n=1 Tax=Tardiphaga sp. 709 TaxID=3076039 RepID=UPI0028ED95AC|nr:hypothetical protein [Tardiphaga sp. 709]WNV08900.1 hypothetical protein RSO67_26050 [Tardiphaga sp. 709]
MPTYLVRIIETRDLVGVFSADNILQLIIIVNECTEPDDCEYARLSVPGGIMWTSPAIPIPIPRTDDEDGSEPDPMPWSEATDTERWWTICTAIRFVGGNGSFQTIRRSQQSKCCRGDWDRWWPLKSVDYTFSEGSDHCLRQMIEACSLVAFL